MEDITSRKHGGNAESIAAFGEGKDEQRKRVLSAIAGAGDTGLTCDELAAEWGVGCNTISGRFSELKRDDRIAKRGTRKTRTGKAAGVYAVAV